MNWLILAERETGQIEGWVSNSYMMPPLSDLGDYATSLEAHELWDKATWDIAILEISRLEQLIQSLSDRLLDRSAETHEVPELSEEDAAALQDAKDRAQAELDQKRARLRPFVEGEISRDHKLVGVEGGFITEPSPNPVQPPPPPPPPEPLHFVTFTHGLPDKIQRIEDFLKEAYP